MVVDGAGVVHAAGTFNRAIWYVTNGSGSWTRDELSGSAHDGYGQPSIARNGSSLWVAFTQFFDSHGFGLLPEGIYYVGRSGSGGWSSPVGFGASGGNDPSIKARNGKLYMAYVEGVPVDVIEEDSEFQVHFATDVTGSSTDVIVSPNGTTPQLALTASGRARIAFGNDDELLPGNALRYAQAGTPTDDFSVETVPATENQYQPLALAHDGSRAHLVYSPFYLGDGLYYARRTLSGWDTPVPLMSSGQVVSVAMAVDAANKVHVVATTLEDGVWYFTNRGGAWSSRQLLAPASVKWFVGSCAIDIDAAGRAHMLFTVGKNNNTTKLWYAASPAG